MDNMNIEEDAFTDSESGLPGETHRPPVSNQTCSNPDQNELDHPDGCQRSPERPLSVGGVSSVDSETIDTPLIDWYMPKHAMLECREREILKSRYQPNSAFSLEFPKYIYKLSSDGQLKPRHQVKGHLLRYDPPGFPDQMGEFDLDFLRLTQHLPSDNRVQLAVDIPWLWQFETYRILCEGAARDQASLEVMARQRILETIYNVADFERKLLDNGDGDFWIMDDTALPGTLFRQQHLYRGHAGWIASNSNAFGAKVPQIPDQSMELQAPWNRLIFCKGLSTVARPGSQLRRNGRLAAFPYIIMEDGQFFPGSARAQTSEAILEAVKLHLSCSKRVVGELNNPYMDFSRGFHITFYERIVGGENYISKEYWKIGHMYTRLDVPPGKLAPMFRRSAFTTVVSTEDRLAVIENNQKQKDLSRHGTMLVFCPRRSFASPRSHPLPEEELVRWNEILNDSSIRISELVMIRQAYSLLTRRWQRLTDYLANLLAEDFMEPEVYVKLIFDDDQLSRSKKYFWILACLQEFKGSIADNITQWKLYRQARLDHAENVPPHLNMETVIGDLERFCGMLQEIRGQMDELAATVQARRDGLFNASALGETMNSTRLGQNVKLLTYVSIFYLPLAFCAALWAIPNIEQDGTRVAFSVTALVLGLVTYLTVANLENVVYVIKGFYSTWRNHLVEQMKDDPTLYWQTHGQRLEDSWPERKLGPSEWMVLRFQFIKLFRGAKSKSRRGGGETGASINE